MSDLLDTLRQAVLDLRESEVHLEKMNKALHNARCEVVTAQEQHNEACKLYHEALAAWEGSVVDEDESEPLGGIKRLSIDPAIFNIMSHGRPTFT